MNKTEIERAIRFFEGWMKYWEGKSGLPKDYQRLMKAKDTAMSALRDALQRQPDPITGLMPCGCGGKAKVWPSDLRQAVVTAYQVGCIECAMTTGWVRGKQENAINVWNTAMGWRMEE